jgi:hypothetical protein
LVVELNNNDSNTASVSSQLKEESAVNSIPDRPLSLTRKNSDKKMPQTDVKPKKKVQIKTVFDISINP